MALTKIINDGDELVFDISKVASHARKEISVIMLKRVRPANVLVIRADPSIPIKHVKLQKIYDDHEEDTSMGLPVYRCHKLVQGAKITKIETAGDDASISVCPTTTLHFENIGQTVTVDDAWVQKHQPEVGGWFVVYEDGYQSYSPSKAFELGYAPV